MNLDISEWKSFKIEKIFVMENGKGITKEEIDDNKGAFTVVQSGEENNGVLGKIDLDYCKQMKYTFSTKPCLTVARSGSAGFVSFQYNGCVVGDSAKILLLKVENPSTEMYVFLQTILTAQRFKYAYGRKVTENKYMNDTIKLPIQHNSDRTPYIDPTCTCSEAGYVPDWEFMENYIKSLHYKPLTTKNKSGQVPKLNVNEWKEFRVGKIFIVSTTKMSVKDDLTEGNIPFISRTAENNGCDGYVEVDVDKVSKGNCLTIGAEGIYCFYQSKDFATGNKVYTLRNTNLTSLSALFITTILNKDGYKYSYGRARIKCKLEEEIIKLPIKHNPDGTPFIDSAHTYSEEGYVPDWQYMGNYIKSLPYGDRL